MNRSFLTKCFALFILCCGARWAVAGDHPTLPGIATAMERFVADRAVVGAVTLVADAKRIVHLHTVGLADVTRDKPLADDAIFWIASMSKPVTGTCVLMLQDSGKLSLSDPISKYLPEMAALKTPSGQPAHITIQHLLTHTSGMSELAEGETYAASTLAVAAQQYAKMPLLFEPGSRWQYSQTSINTAARIVEVVSGLPFEQFVEQRICQPLGMSDTTFYLSEVQLSRLALSYRQNSEGEWVTTPIFLLNGKSPTDRNRFPAANGGLFSTAGDYARFCQMLLNAGELEGHRILSPEAVNIFRTIATGDLQTGFTPGNGWGIGCCVVREPQGVTAKLSPGSFGHGGAYGTQAWIDPIKGRIYLLMIQRTDLPNADASPMRAALQEEACRALDGGRP